MMLHFLIKNFRHGHGLFSGILGGELSEPQLMNVGAKFGQNRLVIAVLLAFIGVGIFTARLYSVDVQAAETESSEFLSKQEFLDILKSEDIDRILKATNKIKRMHYQGEILPVIVDLWSHNRNEYPDLPWSVVGSDIVRLELANILVQAEVNGFINIDTNPLHQYVRDLLAVPTCMSYNTLSRQYFYLIAKRM